MNQTDEFAASLLIARQAVNGDVILTGRYQFVVDCIFFNRHGNSFG